MPGIALAAIGWFIVERAGGNDEQALTKTIISGPFEVQVTVSGELQAKNAIKVMGPASLRNAGIWQVQIESLVPEGTVVKQGEQVAQLNRSELTGKIQDAELNLQKVESQFTQTQLDCTLTLSQARDELINMKFQLEERQIAVEQARFEAPSILRQAELDYEKTKRSYAQMVKNYTTKVKQAEAKMAESGAELSKQRRKMDDFTAIMKDFVVMAPANGMVIYSKDWDGRKVAAGSQINVWNPVVAELPDLTQMISKTYVNEIDIKKIAVNQPVRIGLDADPDRKYTGKVSSVANIGEQRPNSDAKVFEVLIEIDQTDSLARPSMTTSNTIVVQTLDKALFVPLESVFPSSDAGVSFSYVFLESDRGLVRQEVVIGAMNDLDVVVERGLEEGSRVRLTLPADTAGMRWNRLERTITAQQ